jgi:outer membrane protein TolC
MKLMLFTLLISNLSFALSEEQIRQRVLENFPLIEEAQSKLESSRNDVIAAEGEFDHKLSFKSRNKIEDKYDNQFIETTLERNTGFRGVGLIAGHRQGVGNFPAYDGKYETSGAGELFAGISIPLLRNFSTDQARTNLSLEKINQKQAEARLRLKQNMYVHKALSLFYKWQLEERKFMIRKSILELAQGRQEMLQKRFKSGDVERIKIVDNERSIDKRKEELLKSETELIYIRANLRIYLGPDFALPDHLAFEEVANKLPAINLSTSLDREELPQIKILRFEREKSQLLEKLYQQERLPGLGVDVIGARELSGNQPYDPDNLQVAVKFDFPLENRKAEGKSVSQEYKRIAVEKRLEFVDRELHQNFNYLLQALDLSRSRWLITSEEVVRTETMAQAELNRWKQGSSDLFTVNLREQDVADVKIRKWSALYDFQQQVLDLKLFSDRIL